MKTFSKGDALLVYPKYVYSVKDILNVYTFNVLFLLILCFDVKVNRVYTFLLLFDLFM